MVLSGAKVSKRICRGREGFSGNFGVAENPLQLHHPSKQNLQILVHFPQLGNFGSGEPALFPLSNHTWHTRSRRHALPRGEGGTKSHLQRGAVFHGDPRDPKTWFQDVPRPGGSTGGGCIFWGAAQLNMAILLRFQVSVLGLETTSPIFLKTLWGGFITKPQRMASRGSHLKIVRCRRGNSMSYFGYIPDQHCYWIDLTDMKCCLCSIRILRVCIV